MAELDAARGHLVADDRGEPALHAQRADRGGVVGDGVVIGRRGHLDAGGRERAHAVLEQRGRVRRGHGVDVQVGGDPSARVDDAIERRGEGRRVSLLDGQRLRLRGVLEAARDGDLVSTRRDRDLAVAERGDGLERGSVVRVLAPVGIGRGRDAVHHEARRDRRAARVGDVPAQATGARSQVGGGPRVAGLRPEARRAAGGRDAHAEARRGQRHGSAPPDPARSARTERRRAHRETDTTRSRRSPGRSWRRGASRRPAVRPPRVAARSQRLPGSPPRARATPRAGVTPSPP